MAAASPLDGVFAALPTPFDDAGKIDTKAVDHLVDYLCSRPLAGLALCTEAAEDPLLSPEERRSLIAQIAGRAKGRKPLIVSIASPSTRECTELVKLAHARGAIAVILAPFRTPGIGYRELYRHLDRIAGSTELQVMIDVRAENAFDALSPEEIATLAKHAGLKGVFAPDAGKSALETWVKRMRKRSGAVMTGSSLSFSAASGAGATGTICGMAVIASDQAPKLHDAIKRLDANVAGVMEKRLAPAVELLGPPRSGEETDPVKKLATRVAQRPLEGSQLVPLVPFAMIKEALRLQGHPVKARVRSPYEPVTAEQSERLKAALKVSGLLS
jgi:4-hydroxy-tetrahydrodipicolinate synthase